MKVFIKKFITKFVNAVAVLCAMGSVGVTIYWLVKLVQYNETLGMIISGIVCLGGLVGIMTWKENRKENKNEVEE